MENVSVSYLRMRTWLLQKLPITVSHVRNHKLGWQRPVNSKYLPAGISQAAVPELQYGTNCSERPKRCHQLIQVIWVRVDVCAKFCILDISFTRMRWRGEQTAKLSAPLLEGLDGHNMKMATTRTPKYYNWKAPTVQEVSIDVSLLALYFPHMN